MVTAAQIKHEVQRSLELVNKMRRFYSDELYEAQMAKLTAQRFCPHNNIAGERCKDCGATYSGVFPL